MVDCFVGFGDGVFAHVRTVAVAAFCKGRRRRIVHNGVACGAVLCAQLRRKLDRRHTVEFYDLVGKTVAFAHDFAVEHVCIPDNYPCRPRSVYGTRRRVAVEFCCGHIQRSGSGDGGEKGDEDYWIIKFRKYTFFATFNTYPFRFCSVILQRKNY